MCAGPRPGELAWTPPGTVVPAGAGAVRDAVAEALEREARASTPLAPGERIDPNSAPEEELRRLPRVGPATARAIVEERARGRFGRPEDLKRVPGIGEVTASRLAPHLSFPGQPPVAAPPGAAAGTPLGTLPVAGAGGGRLDLNRADTVELVRLPGIGPAKARRIARVRAEAGGFGRVEDLLDVPGIGPATLERLRPLVRVR